MKNISGEGKTCRLKSYEAARHEVIMNTLAKLFQALKTSCPSAIQGLARLMPNDLCLQPSMRGVQEGADMSYQRKSWPKGLSAEFGLCEVMELAWRPGTTSGLM